MAPTRANPTATSQSIMFGAQNPERAMQFLNFLNSPEGAGIYNMLVFGIEGVHWNFIDEANGVIDRVLTGGEPSFSLPNWALGNTYNAFVTEGIDPDYNRYMTREFNFSAREMPLSGFVFIPDAVESEVARFNDIITEVQSGLEYGMVADVRGAIMARNERLEAAGAEAIRQEMQRQINEFLAAR
jgi:putative aldouronate transport system substrate-binding protein